MKILVGVIGFATGNVLMYLLGFYSFNESLLAFISLSIGYLCAKHDDGKIFKKKSNQAI